MDIRKWKKSWKLESSPISMLTCYDAAMARLLDQTSIDAILVGDSVAMTVHGFSSTIHATVEMMVLHTAAVRRGTRKFVVADLPFLSYRKTICETLDAAGALMRAGANAVKLEGCSGIENHVSALIGAGIPVMGHLGYTPQSDAMYGSSKLTGRDEAAARALRADAAQLQKLGAFAIVLECVPTRLAEEITESLSIPTIGIGAGRGCDGQVLVLNDMLGMDDKFHPRFLRKFHRLSDEITRAVDDFADQVRSRHFPAEKESYGLTINQTAERPGMAGAEINKIERTETRVRSDHGGVA